MNMKKLIYLLSLAFVIGMSSCDDYLDVNTDPDNPSATTATVYARLPWIQNYYAYAWGTAGMRVNTIAGYLTQTNASGNNSLLAAWNPAQGSCTTVYQNWYIGSAVNIQPMIDKATQIGAYHYIGAGYCIYAMGFMMMLDLHGELPIQEAFISKTDPVYDDGKSMYTICMDYLDKAIENFKKTQEEGCPTLKVGDLWNGGDAAKWLKLCYGLKARYLLKLSKKADFNAEEVLTALNNAPQSNADNTMMKHYNIAGDELNFTVSDPYQTNALWNCIGYGVTQRLTRYYVDQLTNNFQGGSGVTDPRLSKLVPAIMTNVILDTSGSILNYEWKRDVGLDMMNSDIRLQGGPIATVFAYADNTKVKYMIADATEKTKFIESIQANNHKVELVGDSVHVTYRKGAPYCNSTNYKRAGDTIYVNLRANSLSATSGRSATDMYYYPANGYNYVAGTGTFYARPDSDTDFLTYGEMCFIKAEVNFRKGDKANALQAYKAGVQAHFDRMQTKLGQWKAAGTVNPDQMPMIEADITAYMSSAAVCQNAADLTMAEIIRQKTIAMGFDPEVWNDMRRFNYSAGNVGGFGNVYPNYKRPYEFTATNKIIGSTPNDLTYWPRRLQQSTHESNYNLTQLNKSNKNAMNDPIWSCPVWWDCATDEEYYGYVRP